MQYRPYNQGDDGGTHVLRGRVFVPAILLMLGAIMVVYHYSYSSALPSSTGQLLPTRTVRPLETTQFTAHLSRSHTAGLASHEVIDRLAQIRDPLTPPSEQSSAVLESLRRSEDALCQPRTPVDMSRAPPKLPSECVHVQLIWVTQRNMTENVVKRLINNLSGHVGDYCGALIFPHVGRTLAENKAYWEHYIRSVRSELEQRKLSSKRIILLTSETLSNLPYCVASELRSEISHFQAHPARIYALERASTYLWITSSANAQTIYETDDMHPLLWTVEQTRQTEKGGTPSTERVYTLEPMPLLPGYISDWLLLPSPAHSSLETELRLSRRLSPYHRRKLATASARIYDPMFELSSLLPSANDVNLRRTRGTPTTGKGTRWVQRRDAMYGTNVAPSSFHLTWVPNLSQLPPIVHSGEQLPQYLEASEKGHATQPLADPTVSDMLHPLPLAHLSFLPLPISQPLGSPSVQNNMKELVVSLRGLHERPHSREMPRGLFALGAGFAAGGLTQREAFPALLPLLPTDSVDSDVLGDVARGLVMQRWLWDQGMTIALGGVGRIDASAEVLSQEPLPMFRKFERKNVLSNEGKLVAAVVRRLLSPESQSMASTDPLNRYLQLVAQLYDAGLIAQFSLKTAYLWIKDLASMRKHNQPRPAAPRLEWTRHPALVAHCLLAASFIQTHLNIAGYRNPDEIPSQLWVLLDGAMDLLRPMSFSSNTTHSNPWFIEGLHDLVHGRTLSQDDTCLRELRRQGYHEDQIIQSLVAIADAPLPKVNESKSRRRQTDIGPYDVVVVSGQTRTLTARVTDLPDTWGCMRVPNGTPSPRSAEIHPLGRNIATNLVAPLLNSGSTVSVVQHLLTPQKVVSEELAMLTAMPKHSESTSKLDELLNRLGKKMSNQKHVNTCERRLSFFNAIKPHLVLERRRLHHRCTAELEPRTAVAHENYDTSAYHPKMFPSSLFYQMLSLYGAFQLVRMQESLELPSNTPRFRSFIRTRPDVILFSKFTPSYLNASVVGFPNKARCCCGNEDWFGYGPRHAAEPYFLRGLYLDIIPVWLWHPRIRSEDLRQRSVAPPKSEVKLLTPTAGTLTPPWFSPEVMSREAWSLRQSELHSRTRTKPSQYPLQHGSHLDSVESMLRWTAEEHLEGFLATYGHIHLHPFDQLEACVVKSYSTQCK